MIDDGLIDEKMDAFVSLLRRIRVLMNDEDIICDEERWAELLDSLEYKAASALMEIL